MVFSKSVSDFATGDVTISGAGATTGTVTGSGTTYNVAVTGMTTDGIVTASIPAGVAADSLGNPNTPSTSSDNEITFSVTDGGGPTGSLTITNLSVDSGKNYEVNIDSLQNGERVYIDRSYTFTNIPGAITGATYIKTANNDKGSTVNTFLSFTVDEPVTVYVGHDNRITPKPSWLNSFTDTGMDLVTSDTTLELYSKSFPAGTVVLGGNDGSGKSMYSVVVISP